MKLKIQILFMLFGNLFGFSQTQETLEGDTQKMYDASFRAVYEEIVNCSYPKLFEFIKKEDMIKSLKSLNENPDFQLRLVHQKPEFNYGEVKNIEGKFVCLISYKNAFRMTYVKTISDELSKSVLSQFLQNPDYTSALFEKDRNSFLLETVSYLIAVYDETTENSWKFINYSKTESSYFIKVLGSTIVRELGL
jgi:hypothetical protein